MTTELWNQSTDGLKLNYSLISIFRVRSLMSHPRRVRQGCDGHPERRIIVSIHAPARGATANAHHHTSRLKKFQFTHPRGVRPTDRTCLDYPQRVSIHAPARGATAAAIAYDKLRGGFNSRTREGCDKYTLPPSVPLKGFQFTHPRGVRLEELHKKTGLKLFQFTHPRGVRLTRRGSSDSKSIGFNSRTREGCDSNWPPRNP